MEEYALKLTSSRETLLASGVPVGIQASVAMTRAASEDELLESAADRLDRMIAYGTTTVESKSGYGLSLRDEIKMLRVNMRLKKNDVEGSQILPDIVSTFLGAHAYPPEMEQGKYLDLILHEMLPRVAEEKLAEFCDVYIDKGYFNLAHTRQILETARKAGFKLKLHADQYSNLGGGELAADMKIVSADHLNYTTGETMEKLASSEVVGVLMPMIDFAVQHPKPFSARAMLERGMTIALATDLCPGGWTESLQLVIQYACRTYGLSVEEGIYAATRGGAAALDRHDRGVLAPGYRADIQIWDLPSVEDLIYRLGNNAVVAIVRSGQLVLNKLPVSVLN